MKVDLICIDMFQTLVDINARIPFIWQRILKDKYSDALGRMCARQVSQKVVNQFHEVGCKSTTFFNLKTLFTPCFEAIAMETNLRFNHDHAVDVFMEEHGKAPLYDDSLQFFKLVEDRLPVCLVSDADNAMIQPLLSKFKFDSVFISEEVGSYKNDNDSRIFSKVLEHYQLKQDRVIHIGDSSSDIIGANKHGIKSCWINRDNREWRYDGRPDYVVKSLVEVLELIS